MNQHYLPHWRVGSDKTMIILLSAWLFSGKDVNWESGKHLHMAVLEALLAFRLRGPKGSWEGQAPLRIHTFPPLYYGRGSIWPPQTHTPAPQAGTATLVSPPPRSITRLKHTLIPSSRLQDALNLIADQIILITAPL